MMKKVITRKDILTKNIYNRTELIRISIQKNGDTFLDKEYTLGGRGIYIHPSSLEKGIKNNSLKSNISRFGGDIKLIEEELRKEIVNYGKKR